MIFVVDVPAPQGMTPNGFNASTGVTVVSLCLSVSSLPEARCEPPTRDAAEKEEVQEPNHPGLQNPRSGSHQHGRGTTTVGRQVAVGLCLLVHHLGPD